jgi:hypothetical protein
MYVCMYVATMCDESNEALNCIMTQLIDYLSNYQLMKENYGLEFII